MEKLKNIAKTALMYLIFIPLSVLLVVALPIFCLFYVPIDYTRYCRSSFYKRTHHKYEAFFTTTVRYKFYNRLAQLGASPGYFPIVQDGQEHDGYILLNGTALFLGYCDAAAALVEDTWYVEYYEDASEEELQYCKYSASEALELYKAQMHPEHQQLPTRLVLFRGDLSEETFDQARRSPLFYCCEGIKNIAQL